MAFEGSNTHNQLKRIKMLHQVIPAELVPELLVMGVPLKHWYPINHGLIEYVKAFGLVHHLLYLLSLVLCLITIHHLFDHFPIFLDIYHLSFIFGFDNIGFFELVLMSLALLLKSRVDFDDFF